MRTEALVLLVLACFGAIVSAIYWFTSYEDGGTVMLAAFGLLGLLPGSYYFWWSRRMAPRPEDRPDATPKDGAGVVGAFPGSSIWPFVLGMGAALTALAFVFGYWSAIFGIPLGLIAAVGVVRESRHGGVA